MAHEWKRLIKKHKGASAMYEEWVCRRCDSYVLTEPGGHPENSVTIAGLPISGTVDECDVKIVKSIQNE